MLVTNLLSTRRQYVRLVMTALVAVSIQSIFSLTYYRGLPDSERGSLESLGEHSATIPMNALFILLIGSILFKCSRWIRWVSLLLAIPVVWAYILSQRRAAMIALFVGVFILLCILYQRRRRAFWFVAPATVIVGLGFVLATWNAVGRDRPAGAGGEDGAVPRRPGDRPTPAPTSTARWRRRTSTSRSSRTGSSASASARSSCARSRMPDISFFEFWEYIPHNNVLWIWMKLGFLGFAATLFMFGRAVQLGARSIALGAHQRPRSSSSPSGSRYVVMFLVFAYVDIAWDPRSTVLLGLAMALCADFVQAHDVDAERRRTPAFEMVPQ